MTDVTSSEQDRDGRSNRPSIPLPVVQDRASLPPMQRSRMGRRRAIVLGIVQLLIIVHIVLWLLGRKYGWFNGATITPIEPSESMEFVKKGVINAGLVFFLLALLSTLILGRWFCGWGCHVVMLQDGCLWILRKLHIRPKPFRSRLLLWAPLILAFYMFIWPAVHRLLPFLPGQDAPWELGLHLTTRDFWVTFPGLWVGIVFLFICGFVTVYFLGGKGFCTYGCPYGGFFAPLDRYARGSIRVTDDCQQCGHCTAVCTSNVRVHEEVRAWGMVTDTGCMKTMDCVNTCPNDALYFGFGPSAASTSPRATPVERKWDLSLTEEVALCVVFLVVFLSFRGAYASVPLLMSMGIACVLTFIFWKAWRLLPDRNVNLHKWRMKLKGRLRLPGVVYLVISLVLVAFTVQTGIVNWVGYLGMRHTSMARQAVDAQGLTEVGRAHAASAMGYFDFVKRIGMTTDPNHDVEAIRTSMMLDESNQAEERLSSLLSRFPGRMVVRRVELEHLLLTASQEEAMSHVEALVSEYPDMRHLRIMVLEWLVSQDDIDQTEEYARRILVSDLGDDEVRLRLAMLLIRTGRVEEGTVLVQKYIDSIETNGKAWALLAEALAMQNRVAEGDLAMERALKLDSSPMVRHQAIMYYMGTGRPDLARKIEADSGSR